MPGSGTDKTKRWIETPAPVVILVEPQLGDNIGAAARAMANFGLSRLRLVKPRDGWPNPRAWVAASGADRVLDQAELFDTVEAAIADLTFVLATTARAHDQAKPVVSPQEAAQLMAPKIAAGETVGVVFGRERYGLENHEVAPRRPHRDAAGQSGLRLAQPGAGGADRRLRVVQAHVRRRAAVRDAAEVGAGDARAVARVLRQSRARAGAGRIFPARRQARHHADQPAQHLPPHGADAAGHPDPAGRHHGDRRGPQGPGARRRARRRRRRRCCARCWPSTPRAACPTSARRCAAWRGCCGAIRPKPSARCGTRSPRTAASPAAASSGRRRSGATWPTWCRSRCGSWSTSCRRRRARRRPRSARTGTHGSSERGYRLVSVAAADVARDAAAVLDEIDARIAALEAGS